MRRKPSQITTGRLQSLRLFSTLLGDIIHYAWCVRMQVSNTIAEVDNER